MTWQRRFLHLVDEFYDRSVNLLLAADVAIEDLYVTGRLAFEMDRCRSRLLEMQSVEYLSSRIDRIDKRMLRKTTSVSIIRVI